MERFKVGWTSVEVSKPISVSGTIDVSALIKLHLISASFMESCATVA